MNNDQRTSDTWKVIAAVLFALIVGVEVWGFHTKQGLLKEEAVTVRKIQLIEKKLLTAEQELLIAEKRLAKELATLSGVDNRENQLALELEAVQQEIKHERLAQKLWSDRFRDQLLELRDVKPK